MWDTYSPTFFVRNNTARAPKVGIIFAFSLTNCIANGPMSLMWFIKHPKDISMYRRKKKPEHERLYLGRFIKSVDNFVNL